MKAKSKKYLRAVLPAMLLCGPAVASSARSISRFKSNSIAVQSEMSTVLDSQVAEEAPAIDPFAVFGETVAPVPEKINISDGLDVLNFLESNDLLRPASEEVSEVSGDLGNSTSGRKQFAHASTFSHCHYTSGGSWYTYNTGTSATTPNRCIDNYNGTWHDPSGSAVSPPPSFQSSSVSNLTATGFNLNVDISKTGTVYAVAVPRTAAAPSSAQVKAGQDGSGAPATANSSLLLNSGAFAGTITLNAANADQNKYNVFFVAEDSNGISDPPKSHNVLVKTVFTQNTLHTYTDNTWSNVDIEIDGNNNIYAFYQNVGWSTYSYKFSKWDNGTSSWSTHTTLDKGSFFSMGAERADMVLDGNGDIHILTNGSTTNQASSGDMYHNKYTGTWSGFTKVYDGGNAPDNSTKSPDFAYADSNNKIHLAYTVQDTLRYSTNASGSWTTTSLGSIASSNGEERWTVVESGGTAHVIYEELNSQDITTANSSDSFAAKTKIVDTSKSIAAGNVIIDASDKMHLVYSNNTDGTAFYKTNASGSWVEEQLTSDGFADNQAIYIKFFGTVPYVLMYNGSEGLFYFKRKVSGVWEEGKFFEAAGANAFVIDPVNSKILIPFQSSADLKKIFYYVDTITNFMGVAPANNAPALGGTFTTNGTVNDNATAVPFSGVTVSDSDGDTVSVSIGFTGANGTLTGTGLTGSPGSYTLTAATPATVQSRLQSLVFHPTLNQVLPGNTVVTTFTLTPNDGTENGTADSSTKITATAINDAPASGSVTANDVVQANAGQASYSFTVTYSDADPNLNSATIDNNDVTVSGGAVVTGASWVGTAASGTATYTITPPGGTWDDTDNGPYTIAIVASQVGDSSGAFVAANGNAGNFNVSMDTTAPTTTISGIDISADNGSSATDFLTNTASQTITATLSSGLAAGEILYGSVDGGSSWINITGKVSGTAISWDGATLSGSSSIKFKVTDAAGNDGPAATQAYVLDTTAPTTTISGIDISADTGSSDTDFETSTASQTISATLSSGLAAGEILYGSVDGGSSWSNITGKVSGTAISWDGTTLSGSSSIRFRVTDAAGNNGATATQAYVLDTTAPTTTISGIDISADTGSSATDFETSTASQTITATLSSGLAAGEILYGSVNGGSSWSNITGKVSGTAISWDGATLSGSSSIKFRVTDAAGNNGATATQAYVLDTTAPTTTISGIDISADSGSSATDFETNTASQTITATLSSGLAAGEILYGSVNGGSSWINVTGKVSATAISWDGATLSGSSSIKFKVTDAAGNDGPQATQAYILDTTAPTTTISGIDISADTGSSATDFETNTASQTITATLSTGLTAGEILYGSIDGGSSWIDVTGKVSTTAINWDGVTLSGSSSIRFKVTDAAGNDGAQASQAYVIDTTAPSVTDANISISGATGTGGSFKVGDTLTATWNNTGGGDNNDDISTVTVNFNQFGGGSAVSASNSAETWTAQLDIVEDGGGVIEATGLNLSVTATDVAGNSTTTDDTSSADLDNNTPDAPSTPDMTDATDTGASNSDNITGNNTPVFTGTAETDSTVTISSSADGAVGSATATSGDWSITASALTDGTHNISATATDGAGNTSASSSTLNVVIDIGAPVISGMPADINVNNDPGQNTAVVNWSEPSANDTKDGAITPVLTAGLASSSAFPVGVTTVTYTATDSAGNSSTASFTVTVVDNEAPSLSGMPSDMTVPTSSSSSPTATVKWKEPTATDIVDGSITPVQTGGIANGGQFPLGDTTVTYTATDNAGNSSTASFTVTVFQAEFPWGILFPGLISPNKITGGDQ